MAVPLIHRCGHCGYESEISSSLSTFTENPFCRQCGLSASESDDKLQDELSDLISRQLTLSQPAMADGLSPTSPITYITQHYHHSGHLVPTSSEDATTQQLTSHGIDITTLSQPQIRLFIGAQPEQKARLIELWQIAPPTHAERNVGSWPQTSMDEEEQAARARYIKITSPITLEQKPAESTQTPAHISDYHNQISSAEPYILHGYATTRPPIPQSHNQQPINYNPSFDPVFQHQSENQNQSREWWAHEHSPQPMEHQYGALMQMKEYYEGRSPTVAATTMGREEDMW